MSPPPLSNLPLPQLPLLADIGVAPESNSSSISLLSFKDVLAARGPDHQGFREVCPGFHPVCSEYGITSTLAVVRSFCGCRLTFLVVVASSWRGPCYSLGEEKMSRAPWKTTMGPSWLSTVSFPPPPPCPSPPPSPFIPLSLCLSFKFTPLLRITSKGEIFGGLDVPAGHNDSTVLLEALGNCCNVPALMSGLQGPWSFAFWKVPMAIQQIMSGYPP